MLWRCFAASELGRLVKVTRIMKKLDYVNILNVNMKDSARELSLGGQCWCFMQDNDPKHSAKFDHKMARG